MVNVECRRAGIGCVDCKRLLAKNLNHELEPFRQRRSDLAKSPDTIFDVLNEGGRRARDIAEATMRDVRQAIGLP